MADGAKSDHPAVQKQLDRLSLLARGGDTLGLERISAVLKRFDNPQDAMPPVFHVAGTNGKGSTCAFLRAAIEAEGLKAHVYTSPHLIEFNERIRIAGSLIEDEYLAELLKRVLDVSDDICPTFFEATTTAALLAFTENTADACILEVGVGGRLDATNIINNPAATGIAALGIDHKEFLLDPDEEGAPTDDLARIAWKKAGIAKKGAPLLTQKYRDDMMSVISGCCANVGADFLPRGDIWDAAVYEGQLHYRDKTGKLNLPLPALSGSHQADNAALAIAMLRHQDSVQISEGALKAAMGWAKWPARMQKLDHGPLTALAPDAEIWLDGGHNLSAAAQIAEFFNSSCEQNHPVHLVLGMLSNKDAQGFIEILGRETSQFKSMHAIPIIGHEMHQPSDLTAMAKGAGFQQTGIADGVAQALSLWQSDQRPGDPYGNILIAGSLYLAGEALKANDQVPD
ncbi:MAG: folylpolyglutamate synthase/dihydrofolate synthase family protein [Parasphingorhabdus sp.]